MSCSFSCCLTPLDRAVVSRAHISARCLSYSVKPALSATFSASALRFPRAMTTRSVPDESQCRGGDAIQIKQQTDPIDQERRTSSQRCQVAALPLLTPAAASLHSPPPHHHHHPAGVGLAPMPPNRPPTGDRCAMDLAATGPWDASPTSCLQPPQGGRPRPPSTQVSP